MPTVSESNILIMKEGKKRKTFQNDGEKDITTKMKPGAGKNKASDKRRVR